jgi:DNA-binding NtrC family response regulator
VAPRRRGRHLFDGLPAAIIVLEPAKVMRSAQFNQTAYSCGAPSVSPGSGCTDLARQVYELSMQRWSGERAIPLIGRCAAMCDVQHRLLQFAQADSPILITGETGTGKELFARAACVLSPRRQGPFLSVNCARYQDGNLLASELFGHAKGSFTGAVTDRPGFFEDAHGGVLFLDEVGELSRSAQAMLLRVLSEGELTRVGENRPRHVDVRLVAATARDLEAEVESGEFREDLYYRLRYLRVRIPPLREREEDWLFLLDFWLRSLEVRTGQDKRFSAASLATFAAYSWPGNVRELRSLVELAFYASPGPAIEPNAFAQELRQVADGEAPAGACMAAPASGPPGTAEHLYLRMRDGGESFWDVVSKPFMARELNRTEVRAVVAIGLGEAMGSYKRLLALIGLEQSAYLRFMDFLRHHQLKPFVRPVWPGRPKRSKP